MIPEWTWGKYGMKLNGMFADLQASDQHSENWMVSGPITSWQIDGETMETVRDFILGAPKSLQMVNAAM